MLGGLNVIIVGNGPIYNHIKEKSKKITRNNNDLIVKTVGRQDNVTKFMHLSDLIMACGRTALEALACRKPVFAMRKGFAGSINKNNQHKILFCIKGFKYYQDNELVSQLAKLAKDKKYRNKLAVDGYNVIKQYYDIVDCTDQLERIYSQYLN